MTLQSLFAAALLFFSANAFAHDHAAASIVIGPSFARASLPGQNNGAAYLSLQNKSTQSDTLLSVSTPAASNVEMHTMAMHDNVMRMREARQIELPAGATVTMQPGTGYHLMLMGLKAPLKTGDKLPLRLRFQHAGTIDTSVPVQDGATGMPMNKH